MVGASENCVAFIRQLMQPNPEERLSVYEANDSSWLLAAVSELSASLPDLTKLTSNFSSGQPTPNHTYVDGQPSGSWSTMTQRVPQNNESFAKANSDTMSVAETMILRERENFKQPKALRPETRSIVESWETQERKDDGFQQSPHKSNSEVFTEDNHYRHTFRRRRRKDERNKPRSRTNEYFVSGDGIDHEVIRADITRYLGYDALVRPGSYENPQTRQILTGYFIKAHKNLTSAMIADLKAASESWETERRASGYGPNVEDRKSTTHQSRQYYVPTKQTLSY